MVETALTARRDGLTVTIYKKKGIWSRLGGPGGPAVSSCRIHGPGCDDMDHETWPEALWRGTRGRPGSEGRPRQGVTVILLSEKTRSRPSRGGAISQDAWSIRRDFGGMRVIRGP